MQRLTKLHVVPRASSFPFYQTFNPDPPPEPPSPIDRIDTTPKKLEWRLSPELRAGVRFAETRISDLICQNDCQALEFKGYGKNFITSHGFSPDAFVQMAFQAAYFGLYGECHSASWLALGSLTICVHRAN